MCGFREVKAGAPKSSVLRPLLFILYINDLPFHIDICNLDSYADDSTMSASDSSMQALIIYLMADLINFDTWCEDNGITLHLGKTIAIFLSTKHGTSKSCQILQSFPYMTVQYRARKAS